MPLILLIACSEPTVYDSVVTDPSLVPDFSLVDENPHSPLSGQPVSPRDYIGRVTGWYFTEAT